MILFTICFCKLPYVFTHVTTSFPYVSIVTNVLHILVFFWRFLVHFGTFWYISVHLSISVRPEYCTNYTSVHPGNYPIKFPLFSSTIMIFLKKMHFGGPNRLPSLPLCPALPLAYPALYLSVYFGRTIYSEMPITENRITPLNR